MTYDEEVFEIYKQFIFDCEIDEGTPHDGDPSVAVQVDPAFGSPTQQNYRVQIHVYTGYMHYRIAPKGVFTLENHKESEILEYTLKDVCERMVEEGSFDAMITMHEF